ncbi:MAG TPA: response regulator [Trebonia sp.]|nr:response regulator [Trebonia sp.]
MDDDPALGGYLRRVLRAAGFDVVHELDAAAALSRVQDEQWDLLITDIEMPGTSGLELLERVRELAPALPVALLTGRPSVDYAVSALRGAAAEFLSKPVSAADLVTKATELVEAGRAARDARRERVLAVGAHPDDVEIGADDAVAILTLSRARTAAITCSGPGNRRRRRISPAPGSSSGTWPIPRAPRATRRSALSRRSSRKSSRRSSTRTPSTTSTRIIATPIAR